MGDECESSEAPMVTTEPQESEISSEVIALWTEVGNGLEKNATVVWKSAVDSLENARKLLDHAEARFFVEKYMGQIIGILTEQVPAKIGPLERNCVQESITSAIQIVAADLKIQVETNGVCKLLSTLGHCLNKKKQFYRGTKGGWNTSQIQGFPDYRPKITEYFRTENGFTYFCQYLKLKTGTPDFPEFDLLHHVLLAAGDSSVSRLLESAELAENDAILVSEAVMAALGDMSDDELKRIPADTLLLLIKDLQVNFDALIGNRRQNTYEFYAFWRMLVLKMIKSQSLPLKLFGWEQVAELVDAAKDHAPPPRAFLVSRAGAVHCNGRYEYAGETTIDGYQKTSSDLQYVYQIPDDPAFGEHGGKQLTLFRCTMRSQQKWWFLSHADEEQPGTDRDVDYYSHKSKEHEEHRPPHGGWTISRGAGVEPPPTLEPDGMLVPDGEEYNTLEHQLAAWAIENEIVENVLGDTTIHREVVARSTVLANFLASMCTHHELFGIKSPEPSKFFLQPSHLLFAWKTCTRKADAAVSTEVYKLLASILPHCPPQIAVPLLEAVRSSLQNPESGTNLLDEVGEFSSLLALDTKNELSTVSSEVRQAILNLMWALLTCPEISRLKEHDGIKGYVTLELQKDVKGEHRERFLRSCVESMSESLEKRRAGEVDENQALRVVSLANFVLRACPRAQAEQIALREDTRLPQLIFSELITYLERRKDSDSDSWFEKGGSGTQHMLALRERFAILRFVYGLSRVRDTQDPLVLSVDMIRRLWTLCDDPSDRELVMIFLANGSNSSENGHVPRSIQGATVESELALSPAFSLDVSISVFVELFCCKDFQYDLLGDEAYRSFQVLFSLLQSSPSAPATSKVIALDAVWRVCLTAASDAVVSCALKDLLRVYVADRQGSPTEDTRTGAVSDRGFADRILECLVQVKSDFSANSPSSKRSINRCLRILNAAVGLSENDGYSMTSSTLFRLLSMGPMEGYPHAFRLIPHGMQGQACYKQIGVTVKRTQVQNIDTGAHIYQDTGPSQVTQRPPSPLTRLSFDVHPLETLSSIKSRVAEKCQCRYSSVRPVQINGRAARGDKPPMALNVSPDDSVMDELGVVEGCELVFVIADRAANVNGPVARSPRPQSTTDLTAVFYSDGSGFGDKLFDLLMSILDLLDGAHDEMTDAEQKTLVDPSNLVWELLLAMPTNVSVESKIQRILETVGGAASEDDAMELEAGETTSHWSDLVNVQNPNRAVYALLTIDSMLDSAPEVFSVLPEERGSILAKEMRERSQTFRGTFLETGGFRAVVDALSSSKLSRRGNANALRVLKSCIFGGRPGADMTESAAPDSTPQHDLFKSVTNAEGLLLSLTKMVVSDKGISSLTIMDVLRFLRLLFQEPAAARSFVGLEGGIAERFLVTLLWRDDAPGIFRFSGVANSPMAVRKNVHDLILSNQTLRVSALPWLIDAVESIDVSSEITDEHFDALEKLIVDCDFSSEPSSSFTRELQRLGAIVCRKIVSCPRPTSESELGDLSTNVLCGCLRLLRAIVVRGECDVLSPAVGILVSSFNTPRWSNGGMSIKEAISPDEAVFVDLIGAVFEGLLSPAEASTVAMCCDKESRREGFSVILAGAKSCGSLLTVVAKIDDLVTSAAPNLRHRFGEFGSDVDVRPVRNQASKYSGLKNQGCTCYMNSVLQQLFMMPELKKSMCLAPLPASLRSNGASAAFKGPELVGKRISLQWDSGVSYDAIVENFDDKTGMHVIRYCKVEIAMVGGSSHQQVRPEDISDLPPPLPDEFVLSQGRPGKETGVFEVVPDASNGLLDGGGPSSPTKATTSIEESNDEMSSRHLLEQFQRTLIHLEKGSRGRCFDPRALVEACACLKLEFDVWQQNDASEFTTKLLDRLEISLKKWAPNHFEYLDHTFGLKQTKQKICKQCGMKSNREEKLLNIDCQIRGNNDIHEALSAMTEVELMEGSNKVFCDRCKENTDTVLRTAISALPNMLILSLKRFDLDFNTFETVKLNSRCSFGQTLNMKPYTLKGMEEAEADNASPGTSPMDTRDEPEEVFDCEFKLAGVLVHAGVAQGGHYYSFIKDRGDDKWYRFDDEDVTAFDPSSIETECFGGKVKKETKWPNGQVHTVEQEQYANALMLFYEKVQQTDPPADKDEDASSDSGPMFDVSDLATGYQAYEPDVLRSNATHRWQSFLFDREFHDFLKSLLVICHEPRGALDESRETWKPAVVRTLTGFVFDVLLYSSDKYGLNDWTLLLEDVMLREPSLGKIFVDSVASRCHTVADNWLRTYLLDCPDQSSRSFAVRVLTAALRACISIESEMGLMDKWRMAWEAFMQHLIVVQKEAKRVFPVPCQLTEHWASYEDPQSADWSSIGTIISHLNVLIDALPRASRFHIETAALVRNLALLSDDEGRSFPYRRALAAAQTPARLVVLLARDRVVPVIRSSFPALSTSIEAAQTQVRAETSAIAASMMPLGSGHGLNNDACRTLTSIDYVCIMEAVLCTAGLPGVVQAGLVREAEDMPRGGRQRYALNENAENALSIAFQESITAGAPGLGRDDLQRYLTKCGNGGSPETISATEQKINDLMAKYPTAKGNNHDPQGEFLSLEGFLAYYRDVIQTNDIKLRMDLHAFGFRPDLTRRSQDSRFVTVNRRDTDRRPAESIARDVMETWGEDFSLDNIGELAKIALSQAHPLVVAMYRMSEPLSQYMISAIAHKQELSPLIEYTLKHIHRTPNDWNGNDIVSSCTNLLSVICSMHTRENNWIGEVMTNHAQARNVEYGAGILNVLRACYRARQNNQFNEDFHWNFERYISILKELRLIYPVYVWLSEHSDQWSFCEQDITEARPSMAMRQYGGRRGTSVADSDMGFDNSEEEDDDSQLSMNYTNPGIPNNMVQPHHDQFDGTNSGPRQINVTGAGNACVNGTYYQNGYFEDACRFGMEGTWRNARQHFSIFRCNVSNNTKHWYISIVPYDCAPGTASDIDFYTAPALGQSIPPVSGWVRSQEGLDSPPELELIWNTNGVSNDADEDEDDELRWHEDAGEDEENYNTGAI